METTKVTTRKKPEPSPKLDPSTHRRILAFLNEAVMPEDLVYKKVTINPEEDRFHEDNPEATVERETIINHDVAEKIIEYRAAEVPLGFRNLKELLPIRAFDRGILEILYRHFGHMWYGSWSVFPQPIPRRGPGSYDGVVHAALMHGEGALHHGR